MWLVGLTEFWIAEIRFLNLPSGPNIKCSTQQKQEKAGVGLGHEVLIRGQRSSKGSSGETQVSNSRNLHRIFS